MIKLIDILNEIQSSSNVYKITFKGGEYSIENINLSEIGKIKNIQYDMGGGEYCFYPESNMITVDYIDVNEFAQNALNEWGSELTTKYYIKQDLNQSFNLPKANRIVLSKVVIYIDNIEALAKSVNNSLQSNGSIEFFADHDTRALSKRDVEFLQIITDKYGFMLPDNIPLDKIKKDASQRIILQKGSPFITPPEVYEFKIENTETGEKGIIKYELIGNYFTETISEYFQKDFYNKKGKPRRWTTSSPMNGPMFFNKDHPIYNQNPEMKDRLKYRLIK